MSSGIDHTRDEVGPGWSVGYGIGWASGAPDAPERPVWFYGFREDVPVDHVHRDRFRSVAGVLLRCGEVLAEQWREALTPGGPGRFFPRGPLSLARWVTGSPQMALRLVELHGEELRAACRLPWPVARRYSSYVTIDGRPVCIVDLASPGDPFRCLVPGRYAVLPGTTADLFAGSEFDG